MTALLLSHSYILGVTDFTASHMLALCCPCCRHLNTWVFFQSPPNFLHAASLAKHVKLVVVIPEEDDQQDDDDDDPEPLIEVSNTPTPSLQSQPQVCFISHRCTDVCSVLPAV